MQPVNVTARHYDRATIFFHWTTAILVVLQWFGAQTIDLFPRGPLRVDARSVHITLGVALAALLVARIGWRVTGGRRLPGADDGIVHVIAKGTHWHLYVLLVAMVGAGLCLTWTRGDSIFNLFSIPAYDPGNRALVERVEGIHGTIGWVILALAGLHATGGLVHRYLWRDGVLARMSARPPLNRDARYR